MLVHLYIFFQLVVITFFLLGFYTRNEIMWTLCIVMSAVLMFSGYSVESYVYEYNESSGAYDAISIVYRYPYLTAINGVFFLLSIILLVFDIFDKYGARFVKSG